MAQAIEVVTGEKRKAGRPLKTETPIAKKPRLSTSISTSIPPQISTTTHSPSLDTPTAAKRFKATSLPSRITDKQPLPTVPRPQSPTLSDTDYQSIARSAVLAASLARSQARWTHEGIFERYWTKPETGKNARPPPPNNPELKSMKLKGECRIRIEPHILECQMYVGDVPKVPPPPKQSYGVSQGGSNTHVRPYQAQPQVGYGVGQQYHGQNLGGPTSQQLQGRTLPPLNSAASRTLATPLPIPGQERKSGPDPVISKLATRASSDPELKLLMKEVATGNATQDQLKVFQGHIDELQSQIRSEKAAQQTVEAAKAEATTAASTAADDVIQYDGTPDTHPPAPQAVKYATPPNYATPAQPWRSPPPAQAPIILAFTTPGATEDRFLFPQNSILERLSPHHYLASFVVTKRGSQSVDSSLGLNAGTLYWQPITLMLEVKVGLEELPGYVQKWVKPAEEVRRGMVEIMGRCERAPGGVLAMRLPVVGGGDGMEERGEVSKEGTPAVSSVGGKEEGAKAKPRSTIKYVKRASTGQSSKEAASTKTAAKAAPGAKEDSVDNGKVPAPEVKTETPAGNSKPATVISIDGANDETPTTGTGRPRRNTRKSVRISDD
ncbi:hypothetical protein LTR62_006112 [Meristemomyces frigidus]|uniref:SWR1-complex protein 3 domain-containing protein n=1 Tax=Meristemomyces frigidus TaxID=1508187 RepID=A0AAN7YN38_9PEZI|nr:hypothetical protein LTR62_006112 [Meristemomyces frigidus]